MSTLTHNDGSDQVDKVQTTKKFICSLCGFEFSQEKCLTNHFNLCKVVHNPANRLGADIVPVKTEDCSKELKQCLELDEHATINETFDIKVEDMIFTEYTVSGFDCKVSDPPMEQPEEICEYSNCGYKAQSTDLEEHTVIHRIGNAYVCNVCDFRTMKPRQLKAHIRRHSMRTQHKSNTSVVSNRTLVPHKTCRRKDAESKPFKCTICDYASAIRANLRTHMKTHSGDKPFKCTVCDYACAYRASLSRHIRTHTGEKPFKCTRCSYACPSSANLSSHMRTHTEKSFKCTICDFACARHDTLRRHMRTHTGEKPFKCILCDYACAQVGSLTGHMRTHTGDKSFKCTLCDYACVRSANLTRHMKTHTGEKPFKCTICGYACAIRYTLTKHMTTHTGEPI